MIYCRQCGTANPSDANYCYYDGSQLEHNTYPPHIPQVSRESCSHCGAWRENHALYCHICGESFERLRMQTFTPKRHALTFQRETKGKMVKSIIGTIPFVLVSMLIVIVMVTTSFNDANEQNASENNVVIFNMSSEILGANSGLEQSLNRYRQEETEMQGANAEIETTHVTWQESFLLSHGISYEQKETDAVSELTQGQEAYTMKTEVEDSMPHYVLLIVLLTGVSGLVYRKFRPQIGLSAMAISAMSFAIWYLLPLTIISMLVSGTLIRDMPEDHIREMTFQFVIDGAFIQLGLIIALAFFMGQLWRERRALPYVLEGAKRGSHWILLVFLLFYIGSFVATKLSVQNGHYIEFLIQENTFINTGLVAGLLTILLINIGMLNTLELKTQLYEDAEMTFHLFSQTLLTSDELSTDNQFAQDIEQYVSPLTQLSPWYWFSFVMLILACTFIGTQIKLGTLANRLKKAVGVALMFAVMNTLLIMIASQRMTRVYAEQESINYTSYDALMTVSVTFAFVMVFVVIGLGLRYLWKGENENESNRT